MPEGIPHLPSEAAGARAACASLGWSLANDDGVRELSTFTSHSLKVGRAQSREAQYLSMPVESVVRSVFVVEGNIHTAYGGNGFDLPTGSFVLLNGEERALGKTDSQCAHFYWEVGSDVFDFPSLSSAMGEPLTAPYALWQSLVHVTNAVLNGKSKLPSGGIAELARATAHLMRAVILGRDQITKSRHDLHRSRLLSEAQAVIEQNFNQASFTVSKLARSIQVSEASLRRLFHSIGTSPYAEIQRRRGDRATELLNYSNPRTASDADDIAIASGFSSRTHMWRTLRRTRDN